MLSKKETILIARGLINNKNYAEAEKVLLESAENNPDHFASGMLADLYIKMGRLDDAENNIISILRKEPGNQYALQKKGDILVKKGNYDAALDIFFDIYKRGNEDYFLLKRIFRTYFLMKDYDKSLEYAEAARNKYPDKADIHYHLFQVFIKTQDTKKAKQSIERAAEMEPGNEFYYSQMLSFRMSWQNSDSSEIEEMLEMSDEENPHLMKILAERYKAEKKYKEAVEIYKKIITMDDSEFNQKNLAFLYYRMKEYSKAFNIFIILSDALFQDNIFLTTIIASAKTQDEKDRLISRMTGLANKSDLYKNLWGRIKKLKVRS